MVSLSGPGSKQRRFHLTLRQTTLLVVSITLLGLVGGLYIFSRTVVLHSFSHLEDQEVKKDLGRVQHALADDLASLDQANTTYSSLGSTRDFVQGKNSAYPETEFSPATFSRLNIDVVRITDSKGKVLFAATWAPEEAAVQPLPPELKADVEASFSSLQGTATTTSISGALLTYRGPMLISYRPIISRSTHRPVIAPGAPGEAIGSILMGRFLDDSEIEHLSQVTKLPVTIRPFDRFSDAVSHLPPDQPLTSEAPVRLVTVGDATIVGYSLAQDVRGEPALVLELDLPRTIYERGQSSQLSFLLWLCASGLLFGAAMLFLLEKTVLSRVAGLAASVAAIGASGKRSERVNPKGRDELGNLGRAINRMLGALEEAEEKRHEQETRLRLLVDRMPAILWTTDTSLCFTSSLGAGLEALHIEPNTGLGHSLYEFLGTDDPNNPIVAAHLAALQHKSSTFPTEFRERAFHVHIESLQTEGEAIIGTVGVALDVTERTLVEKALQRSESGYRSLIEEAPYGLCRMSAEGSLLLVNRAMCTMLGYESEEELRARNMMTDIYVNPEDHKSLLLLLREKERLEGVEVAWKRTDGTQITVRLGGRLDRDNVEADCFEVFAEDVTEWKALGDQLRQVQKMQAVGQLAGGIAHDFNNLLMVIKGHIEILYNRFDPELQLRKHLQQLDKAAERAASLTRQLLAFSRMQVLQPRVLDLNRVVAEMMQMLSRIVGENIQITFQPGKDLGHVKADPSQIEQVLLNLVVNARDAMPNGGRLTITTAGTQLEEGFMNYRPAVEPGPYVMLAVTDTGCGMDTLTQLRIFDPFFTTKEPGKGTGLGLSMVYGIVKQSGGLISVHSDPGRGATFSIYLPEVNEHSESAPTLRDVAEKLTGDETVMIVEDEESVRELIKGFLVDHGYAVLEASHGLEALEIICNHRGPIHILVTDVVMPNLSGRELASKLARLYPDLRVLFISGYTNDAVVRHGVLEGNMDFLQKPFTPKDLARKMREILDQAPTKP